MLAQKYTIQPAETDGLLEEHLEEYNIQAVQNDIENLIMQGEKYQAVALLNRLCLSFTREQRNLQDFTGKSIRDSKSTKGLKRQLTRAKKSLKQLVACHQANLSTFAKFNAAIKILQQATEFSQLPTMLRDVAQHIRTGAIGVVLDSAKYVSSFVPNNIPTCPQKELCTILCEINKYGTKYIGPANKLTHCGPLTQTIPGQLRPYIEQGSWLVYPFSERQQDDYLDGFITVFDKDINRYCATKATDFLEHFCYILGCTVSTLRAQKILDLERLTDPLTGIPNRAYLMAYGQRILEFAERKDFPVTLLFIDLNDFKKLNDQLGHTQGDIALQQVAQCLKALTRKYDMAVRLGGDEFVVLLPGLAEEQIAPVIDKISNHINNLPLNRQQTQCHITAAIGSSAFQSGQTIGDLVAVADQAMYANKKKYAGEIPSGS